jgi:peptide/nickel transport system permease protein
MTHDVRGRRWVRLARRIALPALGAVIFLVVIGGSLLGPLASPFDPYAQDLLARLTPPGTVSDAGHTHRLGADELGRDILVRMLLGARFSLAVSFVSVIGAGLLGTTIGLASGYYGGYLDDAVMRITDMQLAFPTMLLALAIVALLGSSLINVVLVFVLTGWPIFARTIRASTLAYRDGTIVEAARCIGCGDRRVLFRHILPLTASPLAVVGAFELAKVIIYEASLGFLGLGVQPPTPTTWTARGG